MAGVLDLVSSLSGPLGGLLGANVLQDEANTLKNIGTTAAQNIQQAGTQASQDLAFKPVTVTGPSGGLNISDTGINVNLDPTGQAIQQRLQGTAQNLISTGGQTGAGQSAMNMANQQLGQVGMQDVGIAGQRGGLSSVFRDELGQVGTAGQGITDLSSQFTGLASQAAQNLEGLGNREQELFNRLQTIQQPELDRQRASQEARLRAQGRLGLSSEAYGASPEQFAFDKAAAEAREANAINAIQLADQLKSSEQQRAFGLAGQAGQLAQAGQGLRGQSIANLQGLQSSDLAAAQAQQALQQGNLGIASGLFGLGSQQAQLGGALQGQNLANIQQALATSFLPENQLRGLFSPALTASQLSQAAQTAQSDALLKSIIQGEGIRSQTGIGAADLAGKLGEAKAQAFGGLFAAAAPKVVELGSEAGKKLLELLSRQQNPVV